jgi:hypothetical protein
MGTDVLLGQRKISVSPMLFQKLWKSTNKSNRCHTIEHPQE